MTQTFYGNTDNDYQDRPDPSASAVCEAGTASTRKPRQMIHQSIDDKTGMWAADDTNSSPSIQPKECSKLSIAG